MAFEAGGWSFAAGHNVPAKLADFPQQSWGQRLFVGEGWEHPAQDQERGCLWLKQEETDEAVSGCGKQRSDQSVLVIRMHYFPKDMQYQAAVDSA